MKIIGITTCVGYADLLSQSLSRWKHGLDKLIVCTSPKDDATQRLCVHRGVAPCITDEFYRHGAAFNKSGAMDEALRFADLIGRDWVLFFDADIVPPKDWREKIERWELQPGKLYGASRIDDKGLSIPDGELAGFFQLWHMTDPVAQDRPLLGNWHNASGYDSAFVGRWPQERRVILDLTVTHLGDPGQNWCGVANAAGMQAMLEERGRRGGWKHERILN